MKYRLFYLLLTIPLLVGAQTPRTLFDGTSLKGWKILGTGSWTVANGAILGKLSSSNQGFSQLVFDSIVQDYRISFQFKHTKGNSGFFIRLEEKVPPPPENVLGIQLVIEPTSKSDNAFGFYETNGRGWIKQWNYAAQQSLYKTGAWNQVTLTANGQNLQVEMNGSLLIQLQDSTGRAKGKLAFKLHCCSDIEIEFKDEILSPYAITGLSTLPRINRSKAWTWYTWSLSKSNYQVVGRYSHNPVPILD